MRERTRNLIFAAIIAFFLITAPLVILFSLGYSFNRDTGTVIQTGIIVIDTNVPRVRVSINGEEASSESDPVVLRNLEAGQYHIKIEREGFIPWSANLVVEAEKVTRVDNLVMLHSDPQEEDLITGKIGTYVISPNSRYVAFTITEGPNEGLWMHTTGEEENRRLLDKNDSMIAGTLSLKWSDNSRMLLMENPDEGHVLLAPHVANPVPTPLGLHDIEFNDIQFDKNEPSTIFYQKDNKVYRLKTGSTTLPELIAENVIDYHVANPKVFWLEKVISGLQLNSIDVRLTDGSISSVASIPSTNTGELISSSATHMAVLDGDNNLWLLIKNRGDLIFDNLAENVSGASWSPDSEMLYYLIESEVWAHDQESLENEDSEFLVSRLSEIPLQIKWHPDSRHLLYQSQKSPDQLKMLHVSRSAPQIFTLLEDIEFDLPQLGRRGVELLYLTDHPSKDKSVTIRTLTRNP